MRIIKGKLLDRYIEKAGKVYEANKDLIDKAAQGIANPKRAFAMHIIDEMTYSPNLSFEQAIKKEFRKEAYMSDSERLGRNIVKALKSKDDYSNKKFETAYTTWRKLTGHEKIDYNRMEYLGDNQYRYTTHTGRKIILDVSNSPEDILVYLEVDFNTDIHFNI